MAKVTPYLITFQHMVQQTGQTTGFAQTPEDAKEGAKELLSRFGIDAEIIEVTEHTNEEISLQ